MVAGSSRSFGSLLKRYRRAAELTQDELARQAGFNANYISMLERGVRPPNQAAVDRLAAVLRLDSAERAALQQAMAAATIGDSPSPFGHLLREFRLAAGLTQEQLAERVNLSARTIGDLERGPMSAPRPDTLGLLIEALDLSPEQHLALEAVIPHPLDDDAAGRGSRFIVPTTPTPLLGRERDEATAVSLLRQEGRRLLTLTGTGGVGKTRLALRVAATVEGEYVDGVVFVPLAPLRDPALLLPTIAAVMGLREGGSRPLERMVAAYLRDRHLLLLLDNFEHLLEAAPIVSNLLAAGSRMRVLVTSRASLRLRGEQELEVVPLALPDPEHPPTADLDSIPAIALFMQRAQAVKPAFRLTPANGESITAICRKVDGLPLAIELAAGWIRVMPPQALLRRLEHRLQLLTEGPRDLPERQQTMRNTIAWSYDLLPVEVQTLFRHLSVFVGGFTLESAEAVCREDESRGNEVLKGLDVLVDHSLVVAGADEGSRFSLLETVREYGQERLEEHREGERLRQEHALYFLSLAETAAAELSGPRQAEWLSRLHCESDNFRAALAWWLDPASGGPQPTEQTVRLATALWRFWYEEGNWTEGRGWLRRALAFSEGVSAPVRARALNTAGMAALFQGDFTEGRALLTESLELFRALGSKHGAASALTFLGYLAAGEMDASRTRHLLEEASLSLPHLTHPSIIAYLMSFLGFGHASLGDSAQAVAFLEEAASLFRKLGDSRGTRQCLIFLGQTFVSVSDLPRAGACFREALHLSRQTRDVLVLYFGLLGLAGTASLEQRPHRAVLIWGSADRLRQLHGLHLNLFAQTAMHYAGAVAEARKQLGVELFDAGWEEGRTMPLDQAIDYALEESDGEAL